jgi:acetyl-CoA C-acetyltransferase
MVMQEVVVIDGVRSALGRRNGSLAHKHANELLGDLLLALCERSNVDPAAVTHVVGGCVQQVGTQSSNVTRNAWLAAGLPLEVPAVTVNTQCGSSQEATTLGHAMVASGLADLVIACGVETMSAIPMGSTVPTQPDLGQPRAGRYLEHYEATTQFEGADRIAEQWELSRSELEEFAKRSQDFALRAWTESRFARQVVSVDAPMADDEARIVGTKVFDRDEGMRATTLEGLAGLKPNLRDREPAYHTAGTSSQISDGAAALLLTTPARAQQLGLAVRGRLVDSVLVGCDPETMLTGPSPATRALLKRTGRTLDEIDLFEVNEAFASVVLAWQKELGVDPEKVNRNGGAIALGHPLGATGVVLLTKALDELDRTGQRTALVSMCCGGGLGTGTILERA